MHGRGRPALIVSEDSEIFEKEKLLEHKRAKFGEEQDFLMDEALEGGRAASATDLARFGISDLASASTNLVGSIFGNRKRLALATAPANPTPSGESGQDGKEPKPKAKAFDAGLERLALQDKLLTSLDKEVNGLLGIIESVRARPSRTKIFRRPLWIQIHPATKSKQ